MNYNQSIGSQSTPKGYTDRLNPDFMEKVNSNERKGDFISLISRGPDDLEMTNRFQFHWKNNIPENMELNEKGNHSDATKYKMLKMELSDGNVGRGFEGGRFPSKEVMMNNTDFLRSDHAAFWFSNHRDFYASFKAVHISDTGK